MPPIYEILIILGLILLNAYFALAEVALISARPARLRELADAGSRGAELALQLTKSPERFLSAAQVGVTLIGVLAGAFGGATLAADVARLIAYIPSARHYADPLALGLVVVVIAYLTLIVGELVPKRIAMAHAEPLACAVAPVMRGLMWIAAPGVSVLSSSSRLLVRLMRVPMSAAPPITEEEVRILLRQGHEAGVFEKAEHEIVERVFRLGDRRVSSLMTPRTEIVWVDPTEPIGDGMRKMINAGHTYYPVCRGNIEHVIGMTSVKKQLSRMVGRKPPDILADLEPALFIPEAATAFKAMETLRDSGRHQAMVVDEYGGVSGIITLNDILDAVIGEIAAARQAATEGHPAVLRADGSWLMDAWLPISEVEQLLAIKPPADGERRQYDTLAGMILDELGQIPRVAAHVVWNGYDFEVVDMDGKRVDKVLVRRVTEPAAPTPEAEGEAK